MFVFCYFYIRVPKPSWRAMKICCFTLRETKHGPSQNWSWRAEGWVRLLRAHLVHLLDSLSTSWYLVELHWNIIRAVGFLARNSSEVVLYWSVYLLLRSLQVVCMNFFDIVLDFILMDAFEDLESPPSSVVAVLRNRWLSDSFKETVI